MTPKEKQSLALQLMQNKLFHEIIDGMERDAVERCIYAPDDVSRARAAMRVQEVRTIRSDCTELCSIREPKNAPA